MEASESVNRFSKNAAAISPKANWFGLGADIYKLPDLFPRESPIENNYDKDAVKKLEALIDPGNNWPYGVSVVQHAANDAYVNSVIDEAEQGKDGKKFMRFYRKYISHSVEDAIAMLCVKALSIMGKYGKAVNGMEYRDEHREAEFLDIFGNRSVRVIMHRECETKERNRESDFQYALSFLFSFAVKLGIKNIEWYIQKRLRFESLKFIEKQAERIGNKGREGKGIVNMCRFNEQNYFLK